MAVPGGKGSTPRGDGDGGRPGRLRKALLLPAAALLFLAAALAGAALYGDRLVFRPDREAPAPPPGVESLLIDGGDGGRMEAWRVAAAPGRPTALLFHGGEGNLGEMRGRVETLRDLGMGAFAIDYYGFGRSDRDFPSDEALQLNSMAAWIYLTAVLRIPADDTFLWGFSLGGYVSVRLAERSAARRVPLVLDSAFTRLADTAGIRGLAGWPARVTLRGRYEIEGRLGGIAPRGLLILHSPQDAAVPFRMAEENFAAYANGPKELVRLRGGHRDYDLNRETYAGAIAGLFGPASPAVPAAPALLGRPQTGAPGGIPG
ncbi:MAG: alpha/beta hydrolase [Deltaproteobacteria bacterium]|jgi:pimeloyl-ACP methyl ester carboxylesterase|nr:alpha/beta hydrolase [Deltaproteobacteria bacterium]